MKYIIPILILLVSCKNSKQTNLELIEKIGNEIIQQTISEVINEEETAEGNCIRGEGDFLLSCFSAESELNWIVDFNNDGENDILFHFMDEGLGGGGNAYGFDYKIAILKEGKLFKLHNIFGGGKLSYGHLSIDVIKDKKIYATYEENPYANMDAFDEGYELAKHSFIFSLKEGKLIEESYQKCPVAEMDKRIFKENSKYILSKSQSLDDSFNEEYIERLKIDNETSFFAHLSGCIDIDLSFSRDIPYRIDLEKNKASIKKELLENVLLLKKVTRYKSTFNNLYKKLKILDASNVSIDKRGGTSLELKLPNNWSSLLFVSGNEEQGSSVTIRLLKSDTPEKFDFWEQLGRKKKL